LQVSSDRNILQGTVHDERGEESAEFFEVHGLAALSALEEVPEEVELRIGHLVVLEEVFNYVAEPCDRYPA
jgi:hypothetical protein